HHKGLISAQPPQKTAKHPSPIGNTFNSNSDYHEKVHTPTPRPARAGRHTPSPGKHTPSPGRHARDPGSYPAHPGKHTGDSPDPLERRRQQLHDHRRQRHRRDHPPRDDQNHPDHRRPTRPARPPSPYRTNPRQRRRPVHLRILRRPPGDPPRSQTHPHLPRRVLPMLALQQKDRYAHKTSKRPPSRRDPRLSPAPRLPPQRQALPRRQTDRLRL